VRATTNELTKLKLAGDRIESVEVFKGQAALDKSAGDPAAANGVISITTKKP
jgi:outer membrane receptor protein involved in Fe transport